MRESFKWLKLNKGLTSALYKTTKSLSLSQNVSRTDIGEILAKECNRSGLRNATATQDTVLEMAKAYLKRLQGVSNTIEFDDVSQTFLVNGNSRIGVVNEWPTAVDWESFGQEDGVNRGVYDLVAERVHWSA